MDKNEREALIQKAYELGFQYERDYRGCAQCAFAGVFDTLGIKADALYKASSGLAGGGGECTTGNCGGFTGGSMAMGAFFGRTKPEEGSKKGRADKYVSFRMTRALHDKFEEKYGGILCGDVQKKVYGKVFDLRKEEDKAGFRAAGAHHDDDKCCMAVGDGAKWAMELLLDEIEAAGLSIDDFKDANGNFVEPEPKDA